MSALYGTAQSERGHMLTVPNSDEKLWQTATAERKRKKPFRIPFEYVSLIETSTLKWKEEIKYVEHFSRENNLRSLHDKLTQDG